MSLKVNTRAEAGTLAGFEYVVMATGVTPRIPDIAGVDHPSVMTYEDLLSGARQPGKRVAVIGAGGVGVDVAVHLVERGHKSHLDAAEFRSTWGVAQEAEDHAPSHDVVLLQRSTGKWAPAPARQPDGYIAWYCCAPT